MCENKEHDSQYLDLSIPSEQNSFSDRINYLLERPNLSKSSSFRKSFLTLTKIEPDKENIFEFKLYNIVSMMYLFTEKNKDYTIYSFTGSLRVIHLIPLSITLCLLMYLIMV